MPTLVPPIKCQGIKTKLIPAIADIIAQSGIHITQSRWIEPFGGSCVVALNIQPQQASICDTNKHIIQCYRDIQDHTVTPALVREYLEAADKQLRLEGENYYYSVRSRFNVQPNSLDFLFLNRACFNGMMRFNRKGEYNVPFCRKPERFRPAYITKIVNQIAAFQTITNQTDWLFQCSDFKHTLDTVRPNDIVYLDPPYMGRHTDYYNQWDETQQAVLIDTVKNLPCPFIFSTWHSNMYRSNSDIDTVWNDQRYTITTVDHFYHVGSKESLRNPMLEALITNFPVQPRNIEHSHTVEQLTMPIH